MIFPVTLGERDKDCVRTFHNNTNAYHAGVITSTCTKEKTLTRVILYSRMSCWTEILPPFISVLYPQKVFEMYCKLDKKKKKHVFDQPEMKLLHHVSKHTEHCVVSPLSVKWLYSSSR